MVVVMKNISKMYEKQSVISNFNLEVEKGECVAIIGESGSGKSTILNIIGLLETYQSGALYLFNDSGIKAHSKKARSFFKDKVGYIFQNFALIEDQRVIDNLKLSITPKDRKKNINETIIKALEKVGLKGYENKFVFQLSGGEQQRVAIARLFLKPCELVLADEPTGSLDEKNKALVLDLLQMLRDEGKTIIMVTHDKEVAAWCDCTVEIVKNH